MRSSDPRPMLRRGVHSGAVAVAVLLVSAATVSAQVPDNVRDALRSMFGERISIVQVGLGLTDEQRASLKTRTGRNFPAHVPVWRVEQDGAVKGWAVRDDVRGKSLPITYLVAFRPDGGIHALEILVYRESHGGEVAHGVFTRQFVGKSAASSLRVGDDIRNISGATISARNVTAGCRALTALMDLALSSGRLASR